MKYLIGFLVKFLTPLKALFANCLMGKSNITNPSLVSITHVFPKPGIMKDFPSANEEEGINPTQSRIPSLNILAILDLNPFFL
jgi:hypothetical protein